MVTIEEPLYQHSAAETHQVGLSNCSTTHLAPFYANNSCDNIAILYGVKQDCTRSIPIGQEEVDLCSLIYQRSFPSVSDCQLQQY